MYKKHKTKIIFLKITTAYLKHMYSFVKNILFNEYLFFPTINIKVNFK